ncbi:hypothetical protein CCACVL1_04114 [Corchorus capsularis]|uniref:Uncharacterized protein n=1 Tax=Corchorus capsularis TaxID=210143 RepID=A0A1R3JUZ6_COCAP|nr:hypothetical protein CCACVL1_04114 [Corchorus capsularis]
MSRVSVDFRCRAQSVAYRVLLWHRPPLWRFVLSAFFSTSCRRRALRGVWRIVVGCATLSVCLKRRDDRLTFIRNFPEENEWSPRMYLGQMSFDRGMLDLTESCALNGLIANEVLLPTMDDVMCVDRSYSPWGLIADNE